MREHFTSARLAALKAASSAAQLAGSDLEATTQRESRPDAVERSCERRSWGQVSHHFELKFT